MLSVDRVVMVMYMVVVVVWLCSGIIAGSVAGGVVIGVVALMVMMVLLVAIVGVAVDGGVVVVRKYGKFLKLRQRRYITYDNLSSLVNQYK